MNKWEDLKIILVQRFEDLNVEYDSISVGSTFRHMNRVFNRGRRQMLKDVMSMMSELEERGGNHG